ncbi:MAG: 50S ribosomal protein L24 [Clostridia bacterium]|nr:50S ribosomal protein L24 [Clostridia bacterium]
MANSNIRTGDTVLIIAGKEKGKTGKVIASDTEKARVTVENINIVHKHRKPRSQKDQGGIKKVEAPISVSNVQIVCPACKKATRIAHGFDEQGTKHRVCKKCGAYMDAERKTKTAKATKAKAEKTEVKEAKEAKTTKKVAAPKAEKKETTSKKAPAKKVEGAKTTQKKAPQAKTQGK